MQALETWLYHSCDQTGGRRVTGLFWQMWTAHGSGAPGTATLWFNIIKALILLIHGFSSETVYFCMVMEKLGRTLPSYPVSSKGILLCPPLLPLDKSRYRVQYRDACKKNWLLLIHRDLFLSEHSSSVFNFKLYEYMSLYDKMKTDTEGNSSQLLRFIIVAAVISTSKYLQMKK